MKCLRMVTSCRMDDCDCDGMDVKCPTYEVAAQEQGTQAAQTTNKQMVAALWRALSDSDVKKAGNSRGVWLPLTKARLNAAYTKVFGL
jgi:hypothetical protein